MTECVTTCTNPFHPDNRLGARILGIREERYKLIMDCNSSRELLFDLRDDPGNCGRCRLVRNDRCAAGCWIGLAVTWWILCNRGMRTGGSPHVYVIWAENEPARRVRMSKRMGVHDYFTSAAKKFCDTTGIPRYVVQQNLFELRMMPIRCYGLNPFRRRRLRGLEKQPLQLIFGCGLTRYPGWVGIDCFAGKTVDLVLDLRRRLPFRDASVRYCFSEHFLEHLYPDEAKLHLTEVHRILKSGGVYRIVVPAGVRSPESIWRGMPISSRSPIRGKEGQSTLFIKL